MSKRFHANRNGTPAYQGEVVRYFFDLTCHHLAIMQASGNYYLMGFQEGSSARGFAVSNSFRKNPCYLEVTAADLPYLVKPDGEWEFRKVEMGGYHLNAIYDDDGNKNHSRITEREEFATRFDEWLSGYRWCKIDAFDVWWDSFRLVNIHPVSPREAAKEAWYASK